jgi:hypothetical protein
LLERRLTSGLAEEDRVPRIRKPTGLEFQLGGAIVLAITTAMLLAHTPAHASAAQAVHGFQPAVYVTAVTAALFVLL